MFKKVSNYFNKEKQLSDEQILENAPTNLYDQSSNVYINEEYMYEENEFDHHSTGVTERPGNYRLEQEASRWDDSDESGDSYEGYLSEEPYQIDNSSEELMPQRAKYSSKIDKFLNNGIMIVTILLIAVILVAFLV